MNELQLSDKAHVLVLDDQQVNLQSLTELLSSDYYVHPFIESESLFRYLRSGKPVDVVLLDIVMPVRDGYEVCTMLRQMPEMEEVPVVFLTSLDSRDEEAKGLNLGAVDYITKPFSPPIVLARVKNHAMFSRAMRTIQINNRLLDTRVAARTAELAKKNFELVARNEELSKTQEATILALSALAETRDSDTGKHIFRTQKFVQELAVELSTHPSFMHELTEELILELCKSAPLHDIGKVAIPDHILLKPGKLEQDEFEIMKTHAEHGSRAIEMAENAMGSDNSFLSTARDIAHFHHEKWDGSGYPHGLSGKKIPLSARIMAIADVYDALTCKRVYKEGMPHEKAAEIMRAGRGSHFDPDILDTFLDIQHRFADIAKEFADSD